MSKFWEYKFFFEETFDCLVKSFESSLNRILNKLNFGNFSSTQKKDLSSQMIYKYFLQKFLKLIKLFYLVSVQDGANAVWSFMKAMFSLFQQMFGLFTG